MATKILYEYEVDKDEAFMIQNSSSVIISRSGLEDIFIYNSECDLLHSLNTIEDLTLDEAFKLGTVHIKTYTKYSKEETNQTLQIDWSQTITDLDTLGFVKTKSSMSFMAVDPRKYWIDDEEMAIDVDCLGTTLFLDESDVILNMWKEMPLKNRKMKYTHG
jgi:hypothetical protein